MRAALLFATLGLLTSAARAQEPAPAAEVVAPDSGTLAKVNVQGNRRVETDAIRAALPVKTGDTYDRIRLKATLMSVWRMGYFSDVKLDVSPLPVPETGF